MKKTTQSIVGTKFHRTVLVATINDLKKVLGKPAHVDNSGNNEINYEWHGETEDGKVFTVYDYNENRILSNTEDIRWHVGGFNHIDTMQAHEEIIQAIIKIS